MSVKWATCNVGATNPEDCGDYYEWGGTSSKSEYTWENYKFSTRGLFGKIKFSKYNTQSSRGKVDNNTTLDLQDDVARQKWGANWRMPTKAEFDELLTSCTWTWTTLNGLDGYLVTNTKTGYTDRSIFLPATGGREEGSLDGLGFDGYYWSSSLYTGDPSDSWILALPFSGSPNTRPVGRISGYSVRPVCP